MDIGIIAPIKFLDRYCITNTQYCLPRLLVDSTIYRKFYLSRSKKGQVIILDCRKIHWKRTPEDFDIIRKALRSLTPQLVISPSFMFNSRDSLDVYNAFVREFSSSNYKILRCLEGASEKDVEDFPKEATYAFPSHMYRYSSKIELGPNIVYVDNHLSLEELDGKDGILVTSLPIRLGLQGRLLSNCRPTPNSLTFYEEEDQYPTIVNRNISDTLEFFGRKI